MDEFKVKKNVYVKADVEYDRVTSVLDYFAAPEIRDWGLRVGKAQVSKIQRNAKRIGTRVHNLAYKKFETGKYRLVPKEGIEVRNCMEAYDRWLGEHSPSIIGMEITRFHEGLGIAGTCDIQTANSIIDIKTSSAIRPQYWIQLAAYAMLYGKPLKQLGIVRLDKLMADYEYKVIEYDKRLADLFTGLLAYYRYIMGYKNRNKSTQEVQSGIQITLTEIEKKLGVLRPEVKEDWSKWHREI